MARPYNKNIQVESTAKLYSTKDAQAYVASKLGCRSRSWLYNQIKSHGIEVKKNGKCTYLYESDLRQICAVRTLSELIQTP